MDRRVAHFNRTFFAASQSFVYHYLSHHRRYKPVCLAYSFENEDLFPFPAQDRLQVAHRRYSPPWFFSETLRRYSDKDPWLTRQLRQSGCSIIHAHFGHNGSRALWSKSKLGMPLVTSFYGYDVSETALLEKYEHKYAELFEGGDLFLALGPLMRERLIEIGCPPAKAEIQRIALPLDRISFRPRKPKRPGEEVRLLFAGRFVEKKGLIYALQALRQVTENNTDVSLRIAGDGPMRPSIEAYVKEKDLGRYVRFLGFLPYMELMTELDRADLFIHPSITAENGDSEGTPTVILEAQAFGLPVISTYHSDIPHIVVPGESALLSAERDVDALAGNILHLLKNQDRWEPMGLEGHRFVSANHNVVREIETLESRYDTLLQL